MHAQGSLDTIQKGARQQRYQRPWYTLATVDCQVSTPGRLSQISFRAMIGVLGSVLHTRYTKGVSDTVSNSIAYHRTVPVVDRTKVLVVGGGPAGIAAAIASARGRRRPTGARTLLVEQYGFLGDMATAALVGPFLTSYDIEGREPIIPLPLSGPAAGREPAHRRAPHLGHARSARIAARDAAPLRHRSGGGHRRRAGPGDGRPSAADRRWPPAKLAAAAGRAGIA